MPQSNDAFTIGEQRTAAATAEAEKQSTLSRLLFGSAEGVAGDPVRKKLDSFTPDLGYRAAVETKRVERQIAENGIDAFALGEFKLQGGAEAYGKAIVADRAINDPTQNESFFNGFMNSAVSAVPEFFGAPANVSATVFRAQNPWTGLASQLIGPGAAYGAAFKISKFGKFATALEAGTARTASFFNVPATSVARAGAIKEFVRFAPLELTRLGTGLTIWPDNFSNLVGDVAFDAAMTGVLGGAGGMIRRYGQSRKGAAVKGLIDKQIGLLPTFELRLMKDPLVRFEDGADIGGLIAERTKAVLTAIPGKRAFKNLDPAQRADKPFWNLTGVGEESSSLMDKLFKVNKSAATEEELIKSGLDSRLLVTGSGSNRINKELQKEVLGVFGMKEPSDLAAAFVYPRMVKVRSPRMAGQMAKTLGDDTGGGMKWFADEGAMVAQDSAGLFVFAKRIGNSAGKTKKFGPQKFAAGDYWVVGKTDKLDLILPKNHTHFGKVAADWAQFNVAHRVGLSDDFANAHMDTVLDAISPEDWAAAKRGTKAGFVAKGLQRLATKTGKTTGLTDSKAMQDFLEGLWDVGAVTARKEVRDPVYQKLWLMMKGVVGRADELGLQFMRGKTRYSASPMGGLMRPSTVTRERVWADLDTQENLVMSLSGDELNAVANATQAPGSKVSDAISDLLESEGLSDTAKSAVRQLVETNRRVVEEYIKPALKAAGVEEQVEWLDDYIMPRIWRGDYFLDVKQGNSIVYRVSGKTGQETQRQADAIVAAAEAKGMKFSTGKMQAFDELATDTDLNSMIHQTAPVGVTGDKQLQDVVLQGLRNANAARPAISKVRAPGTISNARGELKAAETTWEHKDVLKAIAGHQRQLLRYAAQVNWKKRWEPEMLAWEEGGNIGVMAADLKRKASQFAGVEGYLSRAQNDAMRQLTGIPGKPLSSLIGTANSTLYQMMLGIFNVNFALLNVLTPVMTTMPWISYMTSAPRHKQLQYMQTIPKFGPNGKPTGLAHTLQPVKVMMGAMRTMKNPTAAERAMFERASDDAVFDAQLYENFAGGMDSLTGRSLRETATNGGGWEFIKALANSPSLKSEQFSRMTAFSAGLRLGEDFFGLQGEALYRFAKRANEQTMYGYNQVDRARIMTGPIGGLLGLFKNWQFHYINQMASYAGLGVRDGVWAPALWMLGTTGAVAGVGGTALKPVLDGFASWATDSPTAFHYLQNEWPSEIDVPFSESHLGDVAYFGLPALLGASLQASSTMPGTDIVQDITGMGNVVAWERAKQLGTVALKMKEYSEVTGQSALSNDNIRAEFLGVTMPRAVARLYSVTEKDAVMSMRTGYPSAQGISPASKLLHGLGLNQVEIERYQVAGNELFKQTERKRMLIKNLGMAYVDAERAGDSDRMQEVLDQTMMMGLDMDRVLKSGATRMDRFEGDSLDRYDPEDVSSYFPDR